jgi:hypothetical protein
MPNDQCAMIIRSDARSDAPRSSPDLNLSLFYSATAVCASASRPAATRDSRWIYVVHPRKAADDCRTPRRVGQSGRSRTSRKRLGLRQPSLNVPVENADWTLANVAGRIRSCVRLGSSGSTAGNLSRSAPLKQTQLLQGQKPLLLFEKAPILARSGHAGRRNRVRSQRQC